MMTLHGVDIYIWSETTLKVPETYGKFKLELITNRGTRTYPPPAPELPPSNWPRCRFTSDEVVSDKEVDELINHISSLGLVWTKTQKLFREGDVNLYSQPY